MSKEIVKKPEHEVFKEEFRTMIMDAENKMIQRGGFQGEELDKFLPLKHSFGDGLYIREIFNPKGAFIITKIHKKTHPFFLLKGKMLIKTEDGIIQLEAPCQGITKAGTKRVIYAIEDVIFITVHATDKTDLDEIEDEIISKNFEEFDKELNYV